MYDYTVEKQILFTDEGQRMFLGIRDKTHRLLKESGAVRCQEVMLGNVGSTWTMLACVDRMVELDEIREITPKGVPGQYRVFVSSRS